MIVAPSLVTTSKQALTEAQAYTSQTKTESYKYHECHECHINAPAFSTRKSCSVQNVAKTGNFPAAMEVQGQRLGRVSVSFSNDLRFTLCSSKQTCLQKKYSCGSVVKQSRVARLKSIAGVGGFGPTLGYPNWVSLARLRNYSCFFDECGSSCLQYI